jgi:allantoinase
MKGDPDFFALWGGIAGVQHGFELLLDGTRLTTTRDWPRLAAAASLAVARRFRLRDKGALAPGFDADFFLVRPAPERAIAAAELLTRHPLSPYLGRRSGLAVTHTYVRGRAVWADGRLTPRCPRGHFLAPSP